MTPGPVVVDLSPAQSPEYAERGIARHALDFTRALLSRHPGLVGNVLVDPRRAPLASIDEWADDPRTVPLDEWVPRPEHILHCLSPFELDQPLRRLWPRAASAAGTRLVVTLYDLIPEVMPAEYLADPGLRRRWRARRGLVRSADRVLTLSRSATSDATEYLGIPPSKITVIGAGCGTQFAPPVGDDRAEIGQSLRVTMPDSAAQFVVYNGGADPRKNVDGLLAAWARLAPEVRARWQLVIAGRMPALAEHHFRVRAQELGIGDSVLLTGLVPDTTLVGLYQVTDLMVFPSLYEGYGLPVVEAMACGAPVLAAANSSLVELVEPEATFDPLDPAAMARAITRGLTDTALRRRLLDVSARPRPAWDEVADRAAEAYRAVAAASTTSTPPSGGTNRGGLGDRGRLAGPDPTKAHRSHNPHRFVLGLLGQPGQPGQPGRLGPGAGGGRGRGRIAVVLPSADSPWAAADKALADALGASADVDGYGTTADVAPLSALGAGSAIRAGYDLVMVTLAGHPGHWAGLQWLCRGDREPARRVVVIAREYSLRPLYRSAGTEVFAAAWASQYPAAALSPDPDEEEALMVRAAVAASDWYVVDSPATAARVALELPPSLVDRVVVAQP